MGSLKLIIYCWPLGAAQQEVKANIISPHKVADLHLAIWDYTLLFSFYYIFFIKGK